MTHLWFLFSAWSFFSLCRPLARFEVNILPLDMLWLLQAACLPLHCPFQLPLLLLPPGMAPALCLWVHRERTATLSAGTRRASPDTVCPREDKRAAPAPGKSWRSLCRPGNRASGAGRTGPAGRAAARLRTLPNGGFWRSPKERRPCEGSACNCWLADPCRRARSVEWVSSEMQLFGSGASQPGKYPLQHVHTNTTFAKVHLCKINKQKYESRHLPAAAFPSLWCNTSAHTLSVSHSAFRLTHYIHSQLYTLFSQFWGIPDKQSLLLFKRLGGKE